MLKKDKYNVCLIGALAQISAHHVEAIESIPQFTLCAVCDIDRKKLMERYPQLPKNALYTDYEQAIASDDIDIIINASPNKLHTPISIAALRAGKHVLCEKPMTHSMESAKVLYNEVKNGSSLFVVSFHFMFMPELLKFLEERDKFGNIKRFHFMCSEDLEIEKSWILDKSQGGPWLDWASNALSVLRTILCGNELFHSFTIQDVRYVLSDRYEIELKADIDLTLNNIEGYITVDWLSPKGYFMAKTVVLNEKGDEILLDHAAGQILINGNLYWSGTSKRYLDVYRDFLHRLNTNSTNIETGMQDSKIIETVRSFHSI